MFRLRHKIAFSAIYSFMALSSIFAAGLYYNEYENFSVEGLPGRLFVPSNPGSAANPRPLIVALHGGGGVGSNNLRNAYDFDELYLAAKARNAYIYVPQSTTSNWYVEGRHQKVMEMVERILEEREVDPTRIYLTGYSLGGGGVWDLYNTYPDRFAAAIPICSINPLRGSDHSKIAGKPIWAFHARDDGVVSKAISRTQINQLLDTRKLPHPPYSNSGDYTFSEPTLNVRYTEYAVGGHHIWPQVYETPSVIEWLFNQSQISLPAAFKITEVRIDKSTNTLVFKISSTPATDVKIEGSSDLAEWKLMATLANNDGTAIFTDSLANLGKRYYRIQEQ